MIQRIQTVYLLLATVLMAMTLMLPLATITNGSHEIVFTAFGVTGLPESFGKVSSQLPLYLGGLLLLPTLLPIVIIFLFKKRMVQIRLCVSELILQLGSLAFIGIYCYRLYDVIDSSIKAKWIFTLGWASIMPIVAMILVGLAIRGIAKDEALVRSLDRIR